MSNKRRPRAPLPAVIHPRLGMVVHPIVEQKQATHVWQHLYNPVERWDELAEVEIHSLWLAAHEKGCPAPPPTPGWGEERPSLPHVSKACYALLREHHDDYYGPAYLRELGNPRTHWGSEPSRDSFLCCTPRGVLVAVRRSSPATVKTAFRPDLPFDDSSGADDNDYYQEARQRWEQAMTSANSTWKLGVLRDLTEASQRPPRRTAEAWRLLLAIGHARPLIASEPALVAPLEAAEALLASNRSEITLLLEGRLRTDAILEGLEASLAAQDMDEAQDRLLAIEALLVVHEILGLASELKRITERLQQILSPGRRSLVRFAPLAHARLGVSGPAGQAVWNMLLAGLSSALGPLINAQRWLEMAVARVETRLSTAGRDAMSTLENFVTTSELRPTGVLHGGAKHEFAVELKGHCPPDWDLRLFIVDAPHPTGKALVRGVDYKRSAEHWELEEWRLAGADDDMLVIAIAAPSLPSTDELSQLLDEASKLPEVAIQGRWFMPSNGRTP